MDGGAGHEHPSEWDIAAQILQTVQEEVLSEATVKKYNRIAATYSRWCKETCGFPDDTLSVQRVDNFFAILHHRDQLDRSTGEGYISGLMYLAMIRGQTLQLRSQKVKAVLKAMKHRSSTKLSPEDVQDRQQEGYSKAHHYEMCTLTITEKLHSWGIRARLDHLMGHVLFYRGASRRATMLWHLRLFTKEPSGQHALYYHKESAPPALAYVDMLLVLSRGSKTNQQQTGKSIQLQSIRHEAVELCIIGAFAIYMWFEVDCKKRQICLDDGDKFLNEHLFEGGGGSFSGLQETSHREIAQKLHGIVGVDPDFVGGKRTHIERGVGMRMARRNGVAQSDIVADTSYMPDQQGPELESHQAGFRDDVAIKQVHRATYKPPPELVASVYRCINPILVAGEKKCASPVIWKFVTMMDRLRVILLQDAVQLLASQDPAFSPTCVLRKLYPFNTREFQTWAGEQYGPRLRSIHPTLVAPGVGLPFVAADATPLFGVTQSHARRVHAAGSGLVQLERQATEAATAAAVARPMTTIPRKIYPLAKRLKTVAAIWEEYAYGINGEPPLRWVEATADAKIGNPNSAADRATKCNRRLIWDAVTEALEGGRSAAGRAGGAVGERELEATAVSTVTERCEAAGGITALIHVLRVERSAKKRRLQ